MSNGFNPWCLFKRHENGTFSNTDKDRRNYYLIYKVLGMTSLQFMGVV